MKPYEIEVVKAFKIGDSKAFEALYGLYGKKVFALAQATMKNESDAEKVLCQTFTNIWHNIEQLTDPADFNTWIQRTILNLCNNLLRDKGLKTVKYMADDINNFSNIGLANLPPSTSSRIYQAVLQTIAQDSASTAVQNYPIIDTKAYKKDKPKRRKSPALKIIIGITVTILIAISIYYLYENQKDNRNTSVFGKETMTWMNIITGETTEVPIIRTPSSDDSEDATIDVPPLPDWGDEIIADGYLTIKQFTQYLTKSSNSFKLTNEWPIEFSNNTFIVHIDPEFTADMTVTVYIKSLDSSDYHSFFYSLYYLTQIDDETAISRDAPEFIWDLLDITDKYTDITALISDLQGNISYRRHIRNARHNRSQRDSLALPWKRSDFAEEPIEEWFFGAFINDEFEPDPKYEWIDSDMYNATLASDNSNYKQVGTRLKWNNGYLTIEAVKSNENWGIAIYNALGERFEVIDSGDFYQVNNDGMMSNALAIDLWYTMYICDSFNSMRPVFAEVVENDTFRGLLFLHSFPWCIVNYPSYI